MVLHITLSREKSINDKSPLMFVLATVYRPPGHHTDIINEFGDFLSELVPAADKVLIVGDFNIHIDNEKYANKTRGILYGLAGKYPILQKCIKNC